MTLARDGDGAYSVRGATTEGTIRPVLQKLANGRWAFAIRNYLPVDAVSGGDSEVSLVYSNYGAAVTYLAARSVVVRSTPYPPSPVVVGVNGIDEGSSVGRSFDVFVVVSTQRVDVSPEDMAVHINGDGLTVKESGRPSTSADGHARTFAFQVSAHGSGKLPITVGVDVAKLDFSTSVASAVEVAHRSDSRIRSPQAVGLLLGLLMIVIGVRSGAIRNRRSIT